MTDKKKKKTLIDGSERGAKTKKHAARSVRKATRKKGNYKPGPGRPKGSKKDKWGLTPNQRKIADAILDAELKNGLYPASVKELVEITGRDGNKIRELLKRKDFQDYLADQLKAEGVVLEGAFWRGMQLGLQAGDSKVLDLYAKMTGKITKQEHKEVVVTVKGVTAKDQPAAIEAGTTASGLPHYEEDDGAVEEAEVVDE